MTAHRVSSYQARTRGGGFIDAEPVDTRYDHEFNSVNAAISGTKKIIGKIPHPGGRKREGEEDHPRQPLVEPGDAGVQGAVGRFEHDPPVRAGQAHFIEVIAALIAGEGR